MARQLDIITQALTITKETQADRVNNLVAMSALNGGEPMKFSDLQEFLLKRDVKMSKSSWHALRNIEYKVVKLEILSGVADFFGVDKNFLMHEETEEPEVYSRNLVELKKLRTDEAVEMFYRHASRFPRDMQDDVVHGLFRRLSGREMQTAV